MDIEMAPGAGPVLLEGLYRAPRHDPPPGRASGESCRDRNSDLPRHPPPASPRGAGGLLARILRWHPGGSRPARGACLRPLDPVRRPAAPRRSSAGIEIPDPLLIPPVPPRGTEGRPVHRAGEAARSKKAGRRPERVPPAEGGLGRAPPAKNRRLGACRGNPAGTEIPPSGGLPGWETGAWKFNNFWGIPSLIKGSLGVAHATSHNQAYSAAQRTEYLKNPVPTRDADVFPEVASLAFACSWSTEDAPEGADREAQLGGRHGGRRIAPPP